MAGSVSGTFHGMPAAPLLRRAWGYSQLMRLDRPIGIATKQITELKA